MVGLRQDSMVKTKEIVCDLCQSRENDKLFTTIDRLYGCEGDFTYVKCKNCGLVYMNPQLAEDELANFYPEDYSPHGVAKKLFHKTGTSEKERSKRFKLKDSFKKIKTQFLDDVKIIPSVFKKLNKDTKLLDVGCGSGKFLNEVKNETKTAVYGIDISELAVKTAKNNYDIDVFKGVIKEAPFSPESFDVITAWWYLEHVPNPTQVLCKMSELLNVDGDCIIGVPNIASFNGRLFKDKWYHLDCPRHLYLYSPETITKLLDKAGLSVYKIVFGKTARGFLHSLRYYLSKDNTPLKRRKKPKGLSLLKRLLYPLAITVSMLGRSDTMVVYSKRKRTV